ncbi:MAG: glycosyltransferase [Victivallaceae bacterium]|nr:glycosyltransferase [Victivallaceae bacterium]
MKILYVGPLDEGGTCHQRLQALKKLGFEVLPLNTKTPYAERMGRFLPYRIKRRLFGPSDLAGVNRRIMELTRPPVYDILWIDKGLTVKRKTLELVRAARPKLLIVGYSPDDCLNPDNQSRYFLQGLPLYDLFITTKSYNVSELQELGCRKVLFADNAFAPETHRPLQVAVEDRTRLGGEVGFIGSWEKQRAGLVTYLAENGVQVRIWGEGWKKQPANRNLIIENRPLRGDEYARAICAFDINLGFLRRVNRDLQTTRSIEIPACGGFMLAERSNEHCSLFEEGREAEFFTGGEELLRKVRYYLAHREAREAIARAGRERCLRDGYSNEARLKRVFELIDEELLNR